MLKSLPLVVTTLLLFICLQHRDLLFVLYSVQSVLFEKGMEEFTSDGSEQLLHLWGGTIHEPSIPVFSTAVNTRVNIGASVDSLQWPAVTKESSHGIAVVN